MSPLRLAYLRTNRRGSAAPKAGGEKTQSKTLAYIQIMIGSGKCERIAFHEDDSVDVLVDMLCQKYGTGSR